MLKGKSLLGYKIFFSANEYEMIVMISTETLKTLKYHTFLKIQ